MVEKTKPVSYVKGNLKLIEWTNKDDKENEFVSYQIEKFYKSGNEWKTSNTFSLHELQNISAMIQEFIALKKPLQVK